MYMWLLIIPSIPFCLIRTYTNLIKLSLFSVLCAFIAFLLVFGYCIDMEVTGRVSSAPVKIWDTSQVFGHIGYAILVFEGNGVILNLRSEAREKKKYPRILTYALLVIVVFYSIFGTICYLTYRVDIPVYITFAMVPVNGTVVTITVLSVINALASYPF
mmetsp:Transcript_12776/g.12680  ORF Transcript_12776/g.12680 Transcript_12776/m.12680 type:complete len:159 (+) Transcript_12776:449-925(+)